MTVEVACDFIPILLLPPYHHCHLLPYLTATTLHPCLDFRFAGEIGGYGQIWGVEVQALRRRCTCYALRPPDRFHDLRTPARLPAGEPPEAWRAPPARIVLFDQDSVLVQALIDAVGEVATLLSEAFRGRERELPLHCRVRTRFNWGDLK